MRALPVLFSIGLMTVGATSAPLTAPARENAAAALVPLAYALHANPTVATVEVYATEILPGKAALPPIEQALAPGARWSASQFGRGEVYQAKDGALRARISDLPLTHGRHFLSCSRVEEVAPTKIAAALEELWGTPCGTDHSSVELTAHAAAQPNSKEIAQAIRRVGAKPLGVLAGPTGAFALADLPGGLPKVSVGGRTMNLALRISYDKAHHSADIVIGAPTLRPGG